MLGSIFLVAVLLGISAALPSDTTLVKRSDGWTIGFYDFNCDGSVSPGHISGNGVQGCMPVSNAGCMNGSSDECSGIYIYGYTNGDCTGDMTELNDLCTNTDKSGHAIIYENGNIEGINSFQVVQT